MKRARIGLFIALFLAALASYSLQLAVGNTAETRRLTKNFETIRANYCLISNPKLSNASRFATTYSARVSVAQPLNTTGLIIGLDNSGKLGDCYRGALRLSPGFQYSRIFFIAKLQSPAKLISRAPQGPIFHARQSFLENIRAVTPDAGALVAGLSLGDDSKLSPKLAADFKVLSLTHLTAVSGTNCAIVLGLVWFLIGRIRFGRFVLTRWPKLLVSVFALVVYVALVGPQPSVLRASVMTAAVLLAKTIGRGSSIQNHPSQNLSALNALGLAVFALLIYDPWMAFDYGFWLSVLACLGILIVAPNLAAFLHKRLPMVPQWLLLAISVSVSAQLLCFSVLLQLQPGFSTYSVLANLLVEPLVLPITILGILAVIASVAFAPVAGFTSFLASLFAWVIISIATKLAHLPATTGFWPAKTQGVFLAAVLAASSLILALGIKRLKLVAATAGALVLVSVFALGINVQLREQKWGSGQWFVASCNVGQGDATVIRSQGRIALIDVGREPSMVDACLQELHINHIDLLQLTHFDLDHVGGLEGALKGRKVDVAMLTPFTDLRPGANSVKQALDDAAVPVIYAETGLRGKLGDFAWQVLSPHAGAKEAEDSNDGSITMLWRSGRADIITLADLGEKGQMRLAAESAEWLDAQLKSVPLIMKVSHHGSADQYPELIEELHPQLALVSVGRGNSYGHPTKRTLDLLASTGALIERTDEHGSISVALQEGGLALGFQGEQGKTG